MVIRRISIILLLLSNAVSTTCAFCLVGKSLKLPARRCLQESCRSSVCLAMEEDDEDSKVMRHEIEEMRLEALRRIEALNSKVSSATSSSAKPNHARARTVSEDRDDDNATTTTTAIDNTYRPRIAVSNAPVQKTETQKTSQTTRKTLATPPRAQEPRDALCLLDDTCWKIMLNIGREEARSLLPENAPTTRSGTWMPKTWGISGERLLVSLEVEFTPNQLFEREEFLNGVSGAKQLNVVNQELTLGPSIREGSKTIKVFNGGWRICKGEGPLGTDILRFFFEVSEEVSHQGGDVYCPAGRVYCTCGYFPQRPKKPSTKETLRDRQETVNRRYEQLSREDQEDTNLVSWDKAVRIKELLQLRVEAGQLAERVNEARVRDPDKSLLRLSKNLDVGLTREGGVCCRVPKGWNTEYHILGKFGLGAVEKRTPPEKKQLKP